METTLPRDKFLALMNQYGQAGSSELVEAVLEDMGWGQKAAFTKADVVTVTDALLTSSQQAIENDPAATAGAAPGQREHLASMLASLQQHALPLLKAEVEKK